MDPKTGERTEADEKTVGDMVVASLLAGAINGNISCIREVFDRTEGRVVTPVTVQKSEIKTFNLVLKKTNPDGTTNDLSFEQSEISGSLEAPIDVTPSE